MTHETQDPPPSGLELRRDGTVWEAALDREQRRNAVDGGTIAALASLAGELEGKGPQDPPRALILTARGERAFSAGGDLDWFASFASPEEGAAMSKRVSELLARLHAGAVPILVAVQADAWGGGLELASIGHVRWVADHAQLAFRQAAMGVVSGWGGAARWAHQVGLDRLMPAILSAEPQPAAEMVRLGFFHEAHPRDELLPRVRELAHRIADHSPAAVRAWLELSRTPAPALPTSEREHFAALWAGPAFQARLAERRERKKGSS